MPSGKLGNADLAAATNIIVYTVPVGTVATMNASFVNRTAGNINVRMAVTATSTPTLAEYVEYNALIPANGVLERTGIVCSAGELVVCYADIAGVSVRIHGFEGAL